MSKKYTLALLASVLAGLTGPALAAENWPTSVVGVWSARANQSNLTITISSQAASGKCRLIIGTIFDPVANVTQNLSGSYCVFSGRINFARTNPSNNVTFQEYTANLSDNGTTLYMGGLFSQTGVGEYSFFAIK